MLEVKGRSVADGAVKTAPVVEGVDVVEDGKACFVPCLLILAAPFLLIGIGCVLLLAAFAPREEYGGGKEKVFGPCVLIEKKPERAPALTVGDATFTIEAHLQKARNAATPGDETPADDLPIVYELSRFAPDNNAPIWTKRVCASSAPLNIGLNGLGDDESFYVSTAPIPEATDNDYRVAFTTASGEEQQCTFDRWSYSHIALGIEYDLSGRILSMKIPKPYVAPPEPDYSLRGHNGAKFDFFGSHLMWLQNEDGSWAVTGFYTGSPELVFKLPSGEKASPLPPSSRGCMFLLKLSETGNFESVKTFGPIYFGSETGCTSTRTEDGALIIVLGTKGDVTVPVSHGAPVRLGGTIAVEAGPDGEFHWAREIAADYCLDYDLTPLSQDRYLLQGYVVFKTEAWYENGESRWINPGEFTIVFRTPPKATAP